MKIKKILFAFLLFLFAFLLSCSPRQKTLTVLVLLNPPVEPTFNNFKKEMESLGYVEGKNLAYLLTSSTEEEELKPKGRSLLEKKPQLIISLSTPATRAALSLRREYTLPLVFGQVSTLEGIGLNEEERVKRNITGIIAAVPVTKQLEYLKSLAPGTKRVLLAYKQDPHPLSLVVKLRQVAPDIGVELVERQIVDRASLERLLESLKTGEVDAILQIPDVIASFHILPFTQAALRLKVPMGVSLEQNASLKGALFSYVMDLNEHGKEVASLVDKVLKGTPPSRLAVEIPKRYFLTLNLATAREIGLEIPPEMLSLADRLIDGGGSGR